MSMEDLSVNAIELVTKSDILGLASWDRPRSIEQLRSFVARREVELSDVDL